MFAFTNLKYQVIIDDDKQLGQWYNCEIGIKTIGTLEFSPMIKF